jgi:hypothetical protein
LSDAPLGAFQLYHQDQERERFGRYILLTCLHISMLFSIKLITNNVKLVINDVPGRFLISACLFIKIKNVFLENTMFGGKAQIY